MATKTKRIPAHNAVLEAITSMENAQRQLSEAGLYIGHKDVNSAYWQAAWDSLMLSQKMARELRAALSLEREVAQHDTES
jgi:hypothetical protein